MESFRYISMSFLFIHLVIKESMFASLIPTHSALKKKKQKGEIEIEIASRFSLIRKRVDDTFMIISNLIEGDASLSLSMHSARYEMRRGGMRPQTRQDERIYGTRRVVAGLPSLCVYV